MDATVLRRSVWEEMLYADMRSNYFAELVHHYQMLDKWLRVGTLVATSGTLAAILTQAPGWVKIAIPVLATAISFWLLLSQYASLARDAADLHSSWLKIHDDYERLWNNLSVADAEAEYSRISDLADASSKSGTRFPAKKERLGYWLDHAGTMANARYA